MLGRYRLLVVVGLLALGADQGTKALATALLDEAEPVPGAGAAVDLRLRSNPGVAWGLGAGGGRVVGRVVLPATGLAIGLVLVGLYGRLRPEDGLQRAGLALIVGGGLGNLVDRVRLGYVVDFVGIDVPIGERALAGTFNVADAVLVVGVMLVAVGVTRRGREQPPAVEEGPC